MAPDDTTGPTQTLGEMPRLESAPIPLELPKGLVSENAFRWPADPMARGGMAQIFAGEDRRLGRTVILKAPREGEELAPGMAEMFQRRVTAEARILAKLQHPSIVTIYELGKATVGWPFCVLEKVDGIALRDRLDELAELEHHDGEPRTRERLELLSNLVAIAEALAYAHERRVVHRDCTPNNILLGKRGEATLIDWGIARDLDAPGGSDSVLSDDGPSVSGRGVTISAGTPPYLPLEQTQGRAADPSFDVYSFGVTLYEVIAGKPPFQWKVLDTQGERGRQLATFLEWLKAGEPVPPAMPKDRELSGIIARAMTPDASARFTADELVRALKQYLTGDLVFSHRYSITGRLARWARRNKAITVGLAALVVFVIAGALVWAQLQRQARDKAELEAVATAAKADASEKRTLADAATAEAEVARQEADAAQKRGENADDLRAKAEEKRRIAESKKNAAQAAAEAARGTADQANSRYIEAMKQKDAAETARATMLAERDAARTAQGDAETARTRSEREREVARAAQTAAERDRDAAKAVTAGAEDDRDAAREGQTRAEQDREAARAAQTASERDRDAARTAQQAAERDRDELRRRLSELDARRAPRDPDPAPVPTP